MKHLEGRLILQGARILDPANGIDMIGDLAVADGLIDEIAESIVPAGADTVIDVSGLLLTPGLLDIHTHLYHTSGLMDSFGGEWSVNPDAFSFRSGVTTIVDAGSSGWKRFDHFRKTVIDRAQTRVLAFLNIVSEGMESEDAEQIHDNYQVAEAVETARTHRDCIVGIKVAHYRHPDWFPFEKALEAGDKTGLPVMVDFGYFLPERPYWELVSDRLRPGDISTHCFRGPIPILDKEGRVFDYLFKAHERGIRFDLAHGMGSFLFRNCVPAIAQGFPLDSISTDLHAHSMNTNMMDMQTTMSKMVAAGLSIEEVIRKSTAEPALVIGRKELGTLSKGAPADIAVWKLEEGDFGFTDSALGYLPGTLRFICEITLKDGQITWNRNGRGTVPYDRLGGRTGIREGLEFLLDPNDPTAR